MDSVGVNAVVFREVVKETEEELDCRWTSLVVQHQAEQTVDVLHHGQLVNSDIAM